MKIESINNDNSTKMAIAINIDVNTSKKAGVPTISISELKDMVQAYVNSLKVNVDVSKDEKKSSSTCHHSMSSLRGICKSNVSDDEAINEYLSEK